MSKWLNLLQPLGRQARAGLRHAMLKTALALCGVACMLGAAGFAVASLYVALAERMPGHLAALTTAGALVVIGAVFFGFALSRRRRARSQSHEASATLRLESTLAEIEQNPSGFLLAAVATGVIVGLLRPDKSR